MCCVTCVVGVVVVDDSDYGVIGVVVVGVGGCVVIPVDGVDGVVVVGIAVYVAVTGWCRCWWWC